MSIPLAGPEALRSGLGRFLGTAFPDLLALGEPTHSEPAFLELRNDILACLVEHFGYRSIALEIDCLAAEMVDDYVEGQGDIEHVLRDGFSHGFGAFDANRALLEWLREHNAQVPERDRVRLYGFDAPLESDFAPSPGSTLITVCEFITHYLGDIAPTRAQIAELVGDETDWTNTAALYDGSKSIGNSARARELRIIADDLLALLSREAPGLRAAAGSKALRAIRIRARTAVGLLRYHGLMASTRPDRIGPLGGTRDAMMADNLIDIASTERSRGPVLVFAHNAHLQRQPFSWTMGDKTIGWWSAGALISAELGSRYAFVASDYGTVDDTASGTLQHLLAESTDTRALFPVDTLTSAAARTTAAHTDDPRYAPLDPRFVSEVNAVVFIEKSVRMFDGNSKWS